MLLAGTANTVCTVVFYSLMFCLSIKSTAIKHVLFIMSRHEAAMQLGVATAILCFIGYLAYLVDQTDRNPAVRDYFVYCFTYTIAQSIYTRCFNALTPIASCVLISDSLKVFLRYVYK